MWIWIRIAYLHQIYTMISPQLLMFSPDNFTEFNKPKFNKKLISNDVYGTSLHFAKLHMHCNYTLAWMMNKTFLEKVVMSCFKYWKMAFIHFAFEFRRAFHSNMLHVHLRLLHQFTFCTSTSLPFCQICIITPSEISVCSVKLKQI